MRVFLGRSGVGGGLNGAESAFDCWWSIWMTVWWWKEWMNRELYTSEHILALSVQNTSPRLQILPPQPLRQRQRLRIWRSRSDRDLLPRLPLLNLWLPRLLRGLLLLGELLLAVMVLKSLLFQMVDVLINTQSCLLGVGFNLLTLPRLKLLRRHATFLSFLRDLLLHGGELLRGRLLVWTGRGRHCRKGISCENWDTPNARSRLMEECLVF